MMSMCYIVSGFLLLRIARSNRIRGSGQTKRSYALSGMCYEDNKCTGQPWRGFLVVRGGYRGLELVPKVRADCLRTRPLRKYHVM